MAIRFWRRVKLAPGVTLNLSKSGGSLSVGPRGAKFTVGPRGARATAGLTGSGLFYTKQLGARGRAHSRQAAPAAPRVRRQDRLTLGFFRRLLIADGEAAFVDGCRELALGDMAAAQRHLQGAAQLADGAYLAGFMALGGKRMEESAALLSRAAEQHGDLGRLFGKYGIDATVSVPITNELLVHVGADLRGVLLGLVEACQALGRLGEAESCLLRLLQLEPGDVVLRLSLAELLMTPQPHSQDNCRRVVRLAGDIDNETPVHTALMLYKAKALRGLGLATAARETLSAALRRRQGRPDDLLRAVAYERALVYGDLGRKARARAEFEKLYAADPDYEDVGERLGV